MTDKDRIRLLYWLKLYASKFEYIDCIKCIRCATGFNLKEVKDLVDIYGEIESLWRWLR